MTVRFLIGDALSQLARLPDESVHCVVTSPPYWGLRAYKGEPGMIGLEPTFDEHLDNLVAAFREVRRVLRSDGTLWLNYGDAYNAYNGGAGPSSKLSKTQSAARPDLQTGFGLRDRAFKPKDLMMMPARVAMALQADGWWLRSEIIWHKPNPMPESCQDRPTSAHEKLFLLTKSARYFYDAEAVRVAAAPSSVSRLAQDVPAQMGSDRAHEGGKTNGNMKAVGNASGANLRNVWTIATHAYSEAHFATFPPALVEPCIKAGTSARGVCGECGAPWVRETQSDITYDHISPRPKALARETDPNDHGIRRLKSGHNPGYKNTTTLGWSNFQAGGHGAARAGRRCPDPGARWRTYRRSTGGHWPRGDEGVARAGEGFPACGAGGSPDDARALPRVA